ncbi:hypothetical protein SAY86_026711 [Trapa natans]|uniref:Uncharacterized protein n=1 Tax=Trapa natans TaxID=22666 RepID=A0AAN7KK88_TRANT|nr:hypothetical protein SAY86_026711 [Trapa natans]
MIFYVHKDIYFIIYQLNMTHRNKWQETSFQTMKTTKPTPMWKMINGASSNPVSLVPPEEILGLGIPEGAASDDVDKDEDHHRHYKDHVYFPPLIPDVPQQTRLAGVAFVAELRLVIAPQVAVCVCIWVRRIRPQCRVHIAVAASCWRFTAPRLSKKKKKEPTGNQLDLP